MSENFSDSMEKFSNLILTFCQQKFSVFIRQNFWWPFLVIHSKFRISNPLFSLNSTFPSVSAKLLFPLLLEISTRFRKNIHVFLHTLCVFRFLLVWPWCIYASHNARTGRPCTRLKFNRHSVQNSDHNTFIHNSISVRIRYEYEWGHKVNEKCCNATKATTTRRPLQLIHNRDLVGLFYLR